MGHAIGAREQDGHIRGPGNLPADRAVMAARACGVAMEMTQQYLAGELSVLLERVQAVAPTEAAGRDVWSLRQAAETVPVHTLGWVTVRALALTERICWDSLSRGDAAAFTRQSFLVHGGQMTWALTGVDVPAVTLADATPGWQP
jgi:hypothetical protein